MVLTTRRGQSFGQPTRLPSFARVHALPVRPSRRQLGVTRFLPASGMLGRPALARSRRPAAAWQDGALPPLPAAARNVTGACRTRPAFNPSSVRVFSPPNPLAASSPTSVSRARTALTLCPAAPRPALRSGARREDAR